ncbi:hypothetical protein ACTHGU_10090 [Chitinophagaceae bacterium MMS25-I14]
MRYIWQHIHTIIDTYNGGVPLTHFLKNYFRQNPKLGSRDRKILSEMCYSYYRCEKAIGNTVTDRDMRIQLALLLCATPSKHIINFLPENYKALENASLAEKITTLEQDGISFNPEALFPSQTALSAGIEKTGWLMSMLHQPRLFIRVRKSKDTIIRLLSEAGIDHHFITDNCLSLPNGVNVTTLLPEDTYVVQDASSQATGKFFAPTKNEQWYDCCCGAGGKSLLLKDLDPTVQLAVSDIRESILHNLRMRFKTYGHRSPESYILDVSDKKQLELQLGSRRFDHIIADVPCSGSGTWARTPEQLYFYREDFVKEISQRQAAILTNIAGKVKPGGTVFYITCSVFREENEAVVEKAVAATGLTIKHMEIINGLSLQADSMFLSVLEQPR